MKKDVSRVFLYATIVLGLAVASLAWDRHERSEAIKNLFYYSYRVSVHDSETGEILHPTTEWPMVSSNDLLPQPIGTRAYEDGSFRISGMSYMPRTYTFSEIGYKSTRLTIKADSDFNDDIRVEMKPLPNSNENKKKANKAEMATPRKLSD